MILTLPDHMINPKLSCDCLCDNNQKRNKKTDVFPSPSLAKTILVWSPAKGLGERD